ncbi:MAG: hypothetical protein QM718_05045 [Steroidobacteraceae bacterium]
MSEYTVEINLHAARPLTQDALDEVAAVGGAAVGRVGERELQTLLTIEATDVFAAAKAGAKRISHIVAGAIVGATAMTVEEFDAREERLALRRRLVGLSEVAVVLQISRQRVLTLSKREDFPAPLARLASGPVWRAGDISTFAGGWQRKAGRPRKVAAAPA